MKNCQNKVLLDVHKLVAKKNTKDRIISLSRTLKYTKAGKHYKELPMLCSAQSKVHIKKHNI